MVKEYDFQLAGQNDDYVDGNGQASRSNTNETPDGLYYLSQTSVVSGDILDAVLGAIAFGGTVTIRNNADNSLLADLADLVWESVGGVLWVRFGTTQTTDESCAGLTVDVAIAVPTQIPNLTSANNQNCVVTTTSEQTSYEAWRVFNFETGDGWSTNNDIPADVVIQLTANTLTPSGYTIRARDTDSYSDYPEAWGFYASVNGTDWDLLDSQSSQTFGAGEIKSFSVTTSTAYSYFKLHVTATGGATWINIAGLGIDGTLAAISNDPPNAPTGLTASLADYTDKVALDWVDTVNADTYSVYRNTSETMSGAEELATGVAVSNYDDTTATAGLPYFYAVKAVNENGASGFSSIVRGIRQGSGTSGNDPELSVLLSAIDGTKVVDGTTITATEGTNHVDGSYPTTATSKAEQLSDDRAAVDAVKASIKTTVTNLLGTVTGTLNMSLYVLKTDVIGKAWVVTGHDTYVGGDAGEYPTTATSYAAGQAAQLVTDRAAVDAVKSSILIGVTGLLGTVNGGFDEAGRNVSPGANNIRYGSPFRHLGFDDTGTCVIPSRLFVKAGVTFDTNQTGEYPTTETSKAEQLATDRAAVDAVKSSISTSVTGLLGTVNGALSMADYVLKSALVSVAYVAEGTALYTNGPTGEYPLSSTSYSAGYNAGVSAGAAAQLAADRSSVSSIASHIRRQADGGPATVLGTVVPSLNTSAIASAAASSQLTTDRNALDSVKQFILRPEDGGPESVLDTIVGTMAASGGGSPSSGYDPYILRPF